MSVTTIDTARTVDIGLPIDTARTVDIGLPIDTARTVDIGLPYVNICNINTCVTFEIALNYD